MRITHFLHRLPREYSGAATQAVALVGRLCKFPEISCSIVAYSQTGNHPDSSVPCDQIVVQLGRGLFGKVLQLVRLGAALRATSLDILHVHGFYLPVVAFAILMSKKIVLKTTLLGVDDLESLNKRYPVIFRFALLPMIDAVVSLNDALSKANAMAGSKNHLIPNGVIWEEFSASDSRGARESELSRFGISPSKLLFIYAGGDSIRKGFDELPEFWLKILSAFDYVNVHLLVVGRFNRPESRHRLIESCHRESVTIVPEVVDLRPLLKASDVFVSLSFAEGLPNAVLEAIAANVFVLARNLPGVFDGILDRNNSLLFESFDSNVLSQLKELIGKHQHLQVNNLRYARKFHLNVVSDAYRKLYAALSKPRLRVRA
jgi:glycosyltransferase involved in cell wall biosynthesis